LAEIKNVSKFIVVSLAYCTRFHTNSLYNNQNMYIAESFGCQCYYSTK